MSTLDSQRVLVFAPAHNSGRKKDATGAFQPEARAFIKLATSGELVLIDNSKAFPVRRRLALAAMRERERDGFTSVAFFCHGWQNGIQLGFRRAHCSELAQAIVAVTQATPLVVPLYCCSTGADAEGDEPGTPGWGDGSFADRLRDGLCAAGAVDCRVFAHGTIGHTSQNPHVIFFDGMGIPTGGAGGFAPVARGSAMWSKWARALRDPKNALRYRAPYLSAAEIHAQLA